MKPKSKAPRTKRLTLKCDEPLSSFAFKFNLRRYILVAEVARGPLEVPSARRLKEAVAAAHAWGDKLRKALPSRRHRPARSELPLMADLALLRTAAAHLPVQPNDLGTLDKAVEETQAWASRAQTLLAMQAPCELDQAEELLEEGLDLPTHCPEVDALDEAVQVAKSWAEDALAADSGNAATDALRELLEAGAYTRPPFSSTWELCMG
jgi:hypothetical protein